ncbi:EexN family lipoprotein [Yersinia pseudotuberculosis]|uniref:EexN family lipoprotein n=1 Tax=Yersinia pseudotuberculosis TaxID=633 RepID=UPI0005E86FBC|nr:EexN family lipoprotein [Yersinia pseudotuberculosis]BET64943.1 hypothetical protein YPSE1_44020 [Yersinia pseudotuberculosis]CNM04370.1 Uncharacterised protein [Yersinia pseudotuberculosis]
MKKFIVLALVASAALLAGCEEETKSERWYKDHPAETFTVYKKCLDKGDASLNCENARRGAISHMQLGDADTKALFEPLKKKNR